VLPGAQRNGPVTPAGSASGGDRTHGAGAGTVPGLVLLARGGVYRVELAGGETVEASLRGRLKLERRTGDAVVAGDRVSLRLSEADGHTIEAVGPRGSEIARADPRTRGRRAKVIVANVDQIVAVFAHARPAPNPRLIDRFLVLAEANNLPAILVANKSDLAEDDADADADVFSPYAAVGYPVLRTSVEVGTGLEELRARLRDRSSVLTGPSGVGKSSLLNALWPGLDLSVGAVSEAVNKGRHTTVAARLIPLQGEAYVADTPGLRELGLWGIDPADLDLCFREFRRFVDDCRFARSCSHTHEPDCAVRAAVEKGSIDPARHASYAALLEELTERAAGV